MRSFYWLAIALLTFSLSSQAQNAWINEFHYDNTGGDVGESVEVVIQDVVTNLPSDFDVILYNGSGGASYTTTDVSTCTVGGSVGDYVFYDCQYPANGLQNGAPDGLALAYQGILIAGQFLSYEGTFAATNGPAIGVTSIDVGVAEAGTEPIGQSLQLTGTGTEYADFAWVGPATGSPGAVNTGQTITVGGGGDTTVQFSSPVSSAGEGDGSILLTVTISNEDGTNATTADVALISGDAADLDNYTTQMVTFPAGSSANQTVTVDITDDGTLEGNEDFVFEIQNVAGGNNAGVGSPSQHTLAIEDNEFAGFVVINEVDSDTPGTDDMEFIELYDGGSGNTILDGLVLVLVNGSDLLSYDAFDLDGFSTDADGLFLLGNTGVTPPPSIVFANNGLQNGADAVALYHANGSDFPNDTDVSPFAGEQIDVVAYGTGEARDAPLLSEVGATVQYNENYHVVDVESIQRLNFVFLTEGSASSAGALAFSELFYATDPTPGALNPDVITVNETAGVDDVAGWRLLSTPIAQDPTSPGVVFDVDDYASINLVQGIAGGTNPQQYPSAAPNLFAAYFGGAYFPPANTDAALLAGQGFFWYWYDTDLDPTGNGQGTSVSYDLSNPLFQLELTGLPADDVVTGPVIGTFPTSPDGFYMVGNPYAYPGYLGGASVSDGTLSSVFNVWNPGAGSYDLLIADFGDPFIGALLPVWNGAFAEVTGTAGPAVDFASSSDFVDPTASAPLIGREGAAESRIALSLSGEMASGTHVEDLAAMLRFREDATFGWDLHDGSKLVGPASEMAQIAPVGERDGEARRQSARSLPLSIDEEVTSPLAFFATDAGTYEIAWNLVNLPEEWVLTLRDHDSGAQVNLRDENSYVFAADATDWANRFEISIEANATANEPGTELPNGYVLSSVYPNPFNPQARFTLQVEDAQDVSIAVFDLLGRHVTDLHRGAMTAGNAHIFTLDGRSLASGFYVVRVDGESFSDSRRVTLLK